MTDSSWRGRLGDISLFVVSTALAVFPFLPTGPWWGLQHAQYFGLPGNLIPTVGLFLIMLAYLKPEICDQIVSFFDKRVISAGWWVHLLFGLAVAGLGILLPVKTHFLGDGYTVLGYLSVPEAFIWSYSAPGVVLILRGLQSLAGGYTPESALVAIRTASAIAAVLSVWASFAFAKRISTTPAHRVLISFCIRFSPTALFWFGYVEHYPLIWCAVLWFGVCVISYRLNSWQVMSMSALVAFLFVPLAPLILAPLVAWWLSSRAPAKIREFFTNISLTQLVLFSIALGLVLMISINGLHITARGMSLVNPLFGVRDAIFGLDYWMQRGNLILLLVPGLLSLACWSVRNKLIPSLLLTVVAAMSLVGFLSLQTILGVPFDWDLLAIFLALPLLWLFVSLSKEAVTSSRAIAFSLLCLTSAACFVIDGVDTQAAIARHHGLLQLGAGKSVMGWRVLESYYDSKGDTARAGEIAREAMDYFPGDALRAQVRVAINEGRWDEAYHFAQQLMITAPGSEAYLLRGLILTNRGEFDAATKDLDEARRLDPNSIEAMLCRGELFLARNNFDSAIVLLRKSASDHKFKSRALEELAFAWYQLKIPDSLIAAARLIREQNQNSPMVNLAFAEYSIRRGDTSDAREYLELFERYGSGFPEYEQILVRLSPIVGLHRKDAKDEK